MDRTLDTEGGDPLGRFLTRSLKDCDNLSQGGETIWRTHPKPNRIDLPLALSKSTPEEKIGRWVWDFLRSRYSLVVSAMRFARTSSSRMFRRFCETIESRSLLVRSYQAVKPSTVSIPASSTRSFFWVSYS